MHASQSAGFSGSGRVAARGDADASRGPLVALELGLRLDLRASGSEGMRARLKRPKYGL